jgi:two-component system cell cycle sensor histidine kinase/response regulator CckA
MTHAGKTAKQPPSPGRSPLPFIIGVGLIVVAALVYSLLTGSHMARQHGPLADVAMEIKLEAALGHLWFEEVISGDRNEDIAVALAHIDQSERYAEAMLEGGEYAKGLIIPHEDPALRREIEEVLARIRQFRAIAVERWDTQDQSGVGSVIDQRFDAVFDDFLDQADQVIAVLQAAMALHRNRFRVVLKVLIALCLGLIVFAAFIFRRYDRRQALSMAAVRESKERYRAVAEETPVLICRFLSGGEITYANEAYCLYFGKTLEELVGQSFTTFIPEEDRATVMANISTMTPEEPNQSHEHKVVGAKGEIRWQRWTTHAQFDQEGNAVAYQSLGVDITDQRMAEEALRRNEERLDLAMSVANDGFWDWDLSTDSVYFDPRYYTMADYEPDEFPSRFEEWARRVHPDDFPQVDATIKEFLAGELPKYEVRFRFRRKGGEWMWIQAKGNIVARKRDGTPLRVIGTHLDVTEQLRLQKEKADLEEQYHQAQKVESIGRLAGGVAHDLNNLLFPVLGYSEILLEEFSSDDPRREPVEEIHRAGIRARDLVRQLLAFGRKQALEYKPVDMNQVVAGFEKFLRRTIREDIDIKIYPSPETQAIMADVGQIEQVLMNLAVNAADAMPAGGDLTIESATVELDEDYALTHQGVEPGRYVRLAVSDTGGGMDEESCSRIFEPFYSTKGEKGTGLGLATVYGIVKQHGGHIWYYTELGRGTTFKVYLPVTEESPVEESVGGNPAVSLEGTETILLAEDNEQVRKLAETLLKRQGYTLLVAEDGTKALGMLTSHHGQVHLLVTDVVMPGMNGKELFARAAGKHPDLKVLYMSGYTDNVIAHRGVLEDGIAFIQKPFTAHALAIKVREILENN